MSKIRLDTLEKNQLDAKAMSGLKGGNSTCMCSCYYRNTGGASLEVNMDANRRNGYWSTHYTEDMVIVSLDGSNRW